jgi:hypothetical protein
MRADKATMRAVQGQFEQHPEESSRPIGELGFSRTHETLFNAENAAVPSDAELMHGEHSGNLIKQVGVGQVPTSPQLSPHHASSACMHECTFCN